MARMNVTQQNFTSGELSPKMRSRYDLAAYYNGVEVMQNYIATLQGPAYYRNGFRYVTNTPNGNSAKYIPFVFNSGDTYTLEFTEFRLRFFRDNDIVKFVDNASIVALEKRTNQIVVHVDSTNTTTTFHTQNTVSFSGITQAGFGKLNNTSWVVSAVNTSTFDGTKIELVISDFTASAEAAVAATGFADSHVTVTTAFNDNDLSTMQYKQTFDTIYLSNGNEQNYSLVRNSATSWTLAIHTTTGITFSTANNYPHALEIYEQRLWYASTDGSPNFIWGSVLEDFASFNEILLSGDPTDESRLVFGLETDRNRVLYLRAYRDFLLVCTMGGALRMFGPDTSLPITANNILVRPIHDIGHSPDVAPIKDDNDVIFVEKGNKRLRQMLYSFQSDRYEPKDLTKLADHISGEGGFQGEIAYQQGRAPIVWGINGSGDLVGLTYDATENVMAWHKHLIGYPELSRLQVGANVNTIATIPRADNDDQLWAQFSHGTNSALNVNCYMDDAREFPRIEDFYTGNESEDEQYYLGELYYEQQRSIHLDACITFNGSLYSGGSVDLELSAVEGDEITITSKVGGSPSAYFLSSDVGRQIRGQTSRKASLVTNINLVPFGIAEITEYVSSSVVKAKVLSPFTKTDLTHGSFTPSGENEWYITTDTVEGLGPYAGRTVGVVVDGAYHPDVEVSDDGVAELEFQGGYIQFGHRYNGIIRSVDIEAGGTMGPAKTKKKNIAKCGVAFSNTSHCKVGTDLYDLDEVQFREPWDLMNRPTPLFNGEKEVHFKDGWTRGKHIVILSDKSLPCTVDLLTPYVDTSND